MAGNACNPIVFELMVMSVLLGQQKEIRRLERRLENVRVLKLLSSQMIQKTCMDSSLQIPIL